MRLSWFKFWQTPIQNAWLSPSIQKRAQDFHTDIMNARGWLSRAHVTTEDEHRAWIDKYTGTRPYLINGDCSYDERWVTLEPIDDSSHGITPLYGAHEITPLYGAHSKNIIVPPGIRVYAGIKGKRSDIGHNNICFLEDGSVKTWLDKRIQPSFFEICDDLFDAWASKS